MNFYEQLVQATESERQVLYRVPQLISALSGEISVDTCLLYTSRCV